MISVDRLLSLLPNAHQIFPDLLRHRVRPRNRLHFPVQHVIDGVRLLRPAGADHDLVRPVAVRVPGCGGDTVLHHQQSRAVVYRIAGMAVDDDIQKARVDGAVWESVRRIAEKALPVGILVVVHLRVQHVPHAEHLH